MTKMSRILFAAALVVFGVTRGVAVADVTDSTGTNVQHGDNEGSVAHSGSAGSGDAVGGQVAGIVSSGDASIDAKNRSEDADIQSGEAHGSNTSASVTGLADAGANLVLAGDVTDSCGTSGPSGDGCTNVQDGANSFDLSQTATASSGDGVGGQVIGAVVSAGGSADITADNTSEDVDVNSGNADSANVDGAFTGLATSESLGPRDLNFILGGNEVSASDVERACRFSPGCANVQDGDNDASVDQTSDATSGDGVAGQVIGAVSAGDTSIDAKNRSEDVDAATGNADAANFGAAHTGLLVAFDGENFITSGPGTSDVTDSCHDSGGCLNVQDGDNSSDLTQDVTASSGDAVGGAVIGAVTSAGGSADIAADNASEDVDLDTGEANAVNSASALTGLATATFANIVEAGEPKGMDVEDSCFFSGRCDNVQDGDNDSSVDQTAASSSGDGVGGQVIGAVSAGDTSIDAKNRSEDVDIATGEAATENDSASITGLSAAGFATDVRAEDVTDVCFSSAGCSNVQDGDNSTDLAQNATATSGDGVGGQVVGAVTSAGGSADVVADNASEDADVDTGRAAAGNYAATFVGLNFSPVDGISLTADVVDSCDAGCANVQDGDNDLSGDQSSDASSGDGVAGQVLGLVSAGDASVDAKNRSTDVDASTGEATSTNDASVLVGLNFSDDAFIGEGETVGLEDVTNTEATNVQDGDNDEDFGQTASASSGDAVAGQVSGLVVTGTGSADLVLDNSSEDIDAATGEGEFDNVSAIFVGLNFNTDTLDIGGSSRTKGIG